MSCGLRLLGSKGRRVGLNLSGMGFDEVDMERSKSDEDHTAKGRRSARLSQFSAPGVYFMVLDVTSL